MTVNNQYKNAVKILTPLVEAEFQILPTPGNHDYGRWGMNYNQAAARRFQKYIHEELLGDDHENKPIEKFTRRPGRSMELCLLG